LDERRKTVPLTRKEKQMLLRVKDQNKPMLKIYNFSTTSLAISYNLKEKRHFLFSLNKKCSDILVLAEDKRLT
jgi:hypothetical protein